MSNIASLLHEQALLKSRISKTLYGSIEIREQGNKEYIYVHYREDGVSITKYVGEYSKQ